MKRLIVFVLLAVATAVPAGAQFVVIDPENLAQTILIAERTVQEYHALRQHYQTLLRMSHGLGQMERYRIPTIGTTSHNPERWPYGAPWLQGLNAGDARGTLYEQRARRLERPGTLLNTLPPVARTAVENSYATIELTDQVGESGFEVGAVLDRVPVWVRSHGFLRRLTTTLSGPGHDP